jgi:hypothetical protein
MVAHSLGTTSGLKILLSSLLSTAKKRIPRMIQISLVRIHIRTVSAVRERIKENAYPLAIGCGVASGELDRVFLFGRFDFIGRAANEAAEIQQYAWNEI